MLFHSKAPLRIGFAGGGTDPYCDLFGGAIVNTTINLYATATIEIINEKKIIFIATDRNEKQEFIYSMHIPFDGKLDLLKNEE